MRGNPCTETPIVYHWGCLIVSPGYTDPPLFAAGGNPCGTSWPSGGGEAPDEPTSRHTNEPFRRARVGWRPPYGGRRARSSLPLRQCHLPPGPRSLMIATLLSDTSTRPPRHSSARPILGEAITASEGRAASAARQPPRPPHHRHPLAARHRCEPEGADPRPEHAATGQHPLPVRHHVRPGPRRPGPHPARRVPRPAAGRGEGPGGDSPPRGPRGPGALRHGERRAAGEVAGQPAAPSPRTAPPAHAARHRAGTAGGSQPGCAVCAWRQT